MHQMNQAWIALERFRGKPALTVVEIKDLENEVNNLMEKWRKEDDYPMYTLPPQLSLMGVQPSPEHFITRMQFRFETLPGNPLLVDHSTIKYDLFK